MPNATSEYEFDTETSSVQDSNCTCTVLFHMHETKMKSVQLICITRDSMVWREQLPNSNPSSVSDLGQVHCPCLCFSYLICKNRDDNAYPLSLDVNVKCYNCLSKATSQSSCTLYFHSNYVSALL